MRVPERTVEAHLDATGLAVEALRPYLGNEMLALARRRRNEVDVTADSPARSPTPTASPARRASSGTPATSTASTPPRRSLPRAESERPVRVEFAAALLPDLPGVRRVEGAVAARPPAALVRGTLEPTTLTLDVPDIAAAYADLRARWPLLVPTMPAAVYDHGTRCHCEEAAGRRSSLPRTGEIAASPGPPAAVRTPRNDSSRHDQPPAEQALRVDEECDCAPPDPGTVPPWLTGALRATATATGQLAAPHVEARALWTPESGSAVTVTASGEPLATGRRG